MKLELKHLAGYLPYGLNCYGRGEVVESTQYTENPINKVLTITGMDANWVTVEGICITVDESIMIDDCIPILRPLPDLTKEIEHNGEKLVPIEMLSDNCQLGYKLFGLNRYLDLKVVDYFKLLEWHFDIHGLIENNLAIDINTL